VDVLCTARRHRCSAHLDLGGVVEVGGAHGLAHDVVVGAAGVHWDLLLRHDVRQLRAHLLRLPQPCAAMWDESRARDFLLASFGGSAAWQFENLASSHHKALHTAFTVASMPPSTEELDCVQPDVPEREADLAVITSERQEVDAEQAVGMSAAAHGSAPLGCRKCLEHQSGR